MSLPVKTAKLFHSMKTSCLTQPGHVVLFPCQAAAGQRAIAVLSDDVFLFSYFTRRHVSADMHAMFDDVWQLRLRVQYLECLLVTPFCRKGLLLPQIRKIGIRTLAYLLLRFMILHFSNKKEFILSLLRVHHLQTLVTCLCIGAGGWNQSRSHRQVPWGARLPPAGEISPCPFIFQLPNIGVNVKYTVSWQKIN